MDLTVHVAELLSVMSGKRPALEDGVGETITDCGSELSTQSHNSSNSREDTVSSGLFHEVEFRERSIADAIDSLYSLALKIRNPRNRPQRPAQQLYKHVPQDLREEYIHEREKAEAMTVSYLQRQSLTEACQPSSPVSSGPQSLQNTGIVDKMSLEWLADEMIEKYTSTTNFLVRRIGFGNARRKQQFMYWREHAARLAGPIPTTQQQTVVTPQGHKLEWPPPPKQIEVEKRTKIFTCPFCHVICPDHYLTTKAWR